MPRPPSSLEYRCPPKPLDIDVVLCLPRVPKKKYSNMFVQSVEHIFSESKDFHSLTKNGLGNDPD